MNRYFFHLHEAGSVVEDFEGMALVDEGAAREVALRAARDVLAGAVLQGRLPLNDTIVVADRGGQLVLSLTLGEAVGLQPDQYFKLSGCGDPWSPTLQ
jgi:hypothetical protein